MVYAGAVGKQRYTLGVSGRLRKRNLVMWDEETGSLWSQILGIGLHGKSKGVELDMLPAVFVSLETWKGMHPDTKVLDLSLVRQKSWFYTSRDLAAGKVRGRRGDPHTLGVGLRHGGKTVAVPMPLLHHKGLVATDVGGTPLAVVWHDDEFAVVVYDRRVKGKVTELTLQDGLLTDGKRRWDALTGKPDGKGEPLTRFPYLPTYMSAWQTYYPDGVVIEGE